MILDLIEGNPCCLKELKDNIQNIYEYHSIIIPTTALI